MTIAYDLAILQSNHSFFVIIDQITKLLAIKYLQEPVKIFSWLQLRLQINSGVAFSFMDNAPQWISALISIIAVIAIEYYLIFKAKKNELKKILIFMEAIWLHVTSEICRNIFIWKIFSFTRESFMFFEITN